MKEKVTPAIVAVAILIVVLLLGFMGWKTVGSGAGSSEMDPSTIAAHQAAKKAREHQH